MRAVIFVNGTLAKNRMILDSIQPDDTIIAADGGTQQCIALGLTPDIIVGDLDSLSPGDKKSLEAKGKEFIVHPRMKDYTDLELAINHAVNLGAIDILLIGIMGGRIDQTIANIFLLTRSEWSQVHFSLVTDTEIGRLVRSGENLTIHGKTGDTVSLIPFSPTVEGITTNGLKWSLEEAELELGTTLGISNELSNHTANIQIHNGNLLVVHRRQSTPDSSLIKPKGGLK
ncbi:MAG: thiamine diphosphokinase [Anaerolineales bacterium]|nr:thiamine diphosphokinase [Anaerolineales bacterium]